MKEIAKDHAIFDESDLMSDTENWPSASPERNLEGKGKSKWYEKLPYNKFVDLLPQLRYLRGSKAKFTITTFDEINKVCQQIFECHKSFFRFRSQVDLLAHYIGTKILEQVYIIHKNYPQNPLSKILEEQEAQFKIWDQMKTVKEIFQSLCEKYVEGFMTREELDRHLDLYVSTFSSEEDRIKMMKVVDGMMDENAFGRAKERNRKNYENRQRAIEKGIQVV